MLHNTKLKGVFNDFLATVIDTFNQDLMNPFLWKENTSYEVFFLFKINCLSFKLVYN